MAEPAASRPTPEPALTLALTDRFRVSYPGAHIGLLVLDGVANPAERPALLAHVEALTAELRARWAGSTRADLNALPEFDAYRRYYRRFEKTYHVQLQFESVVLKAKPLHAAGALVLAMFAAELQDRLLTAGHDLARLDDAALTADVATGGETYTGIGGRLQSLQPGDMHIRDDAGILSSVIYGPDDRTRFGPTTRGAAFCVYAPAPLSAALVEQHFETIIANARLIAPDLHVRQHTILTA